MGVFTKLDRRQVVQSQWGMVGGHFVWLERLQVQDSRKGYSAAVWNLLRQL